MCCITIKTVEDYMSEGMSQKEAEQQVQLDVVFAQADPRLQEKRRLWPTDDGEDIEEEY